MHAEDRLIHFSTELIHAPVQHRAQTLRKLYYDISQTRLAYDSSDLSAPPQYRFYSRRGSKTQSVAVFLPDRVAFVEEWADMALSDFCDKVRDIGARILTDLGIRVFAAQTVTLRSTFRLTHFNDARVFLLDHACQQANLIGPHFRRPIATGGLRFILPETPEFPGTFHVIIESFKYGVSEIFVEVKGVFGNQQIDVETLNLAVQDIKDVRSFISSSIFPYLDQFDKPGEQSAS